MSRKVLKTKEVVTYTEYKGVRLPDGFPMKMYSGKMIPDAKKATDAQLLEIAERVGGGKQLESYSRGVSRELKLRGLNTDFSGQSTWSKMSDKELIKEYSKYRTSKDAPNGLTSHMRTRGLKTNITNISWSKMTDEELIEEYSKYRTSKDAPSSLYQNIVNRGLKTNIGGNILWSKMTDEELFNEGLMYNTASSIPSRLYIQLKKRDIYDKLKEELKIGTHGYNKAKDGYFYKQKIQHDGKTYLGYGISNVPTRRLSQHRRSFKDIGATNEVTNMWSGEGTAVAKFENELKKVINNQREMALMIDGFKTESASWDTYETIVDLLAQKYGLTKVDPKEFGAR